MPQCTSHLKSVIRQSRSLRNLAETPLLCAMICALHRDRRRELPADRIELYEACCHLLLERRDIERQVDLRDYPKLSYRQKRTLLEDFAYWMIQNSYTMVTVQRTDDHLGWKLQQMIGLQDIPASEVRRLFVERTGMIQEPIQGQINFTHRTFEEFLAAKAALDGDNIGVLASHADNDQWREVIILAAGLASKKLREDLINELIQRGDGQPTRRYQLHLLAVACLETATDLDPSVQSQVKDRLINLVPPKNMTDAKALASAGELAVPFLADGVKGKSNTAAACVRALSLIGGEAALSVLEKYSRDKRVSVIKELIKAKTVFESEAYNLRILSNLRQTNLNAIDLIGTDLSGANLSGAKLSGADLRRADLREADLRGADLSGTHLSGADLSGTNLSGTNLSRTNLSRTKIDDTTQIDDKWRLVWEIVNHGARKRDLSEADLNEVNLRRANLSGANLRWASLGGANLNGTNLSGTNLHKANLRGANLSEANLSEANLSEANLSEANLRETKLRGVNLRGST
jgi:uncharacterized protein YjbI with pentapeptide repeats